MGGNGLARAAIIIGLVVAALGAAFLYRDRLPLVKHLGNLPGDIHYRSGHATIHVPIVTCIVVSIVLSLVLRLFRG